MLDKYSFVKCRENYRWPPSDPVRSVSEARISRLETLVIENILRRGIFYSKYVLSEVVDWKIGSTEKKNIFKDNDSQTVENKVRNVLRSIASNPDEVSFCIEEFAVNNKLRGVGIPVASAFLRFLDPIQHRYGIIDRYIAVFLNREGYTDFEFEGKYIANTEKNVGEYEKFHIFLKKKANELEGTNFKGERGTDAIFTPVDVEMALFTYCTSPLYGRNLNLATDSMSNLRNDRCPKCGSAMQLHHYPESGNLFKFCTNSSCRYVEGRY